MAKQKYIWITDSHLNDSSNLSKIKLLNIYKKENPDGIFITGDISQGPKLTQDLADLAFNFKKNIYFVLGNHDFWYSSIEKTHEKVIKTCDKYKNLKWLFNSEVQELTKNTCIIGAEGWYDAILGSPDYLLFTGDWIMMDDLRKLNSMKERIKKFAEIAEISNSLIKKNLTQALKQYKTVYLLTHFPPWKEATKNEGTVLEKYFLSYNVNYNLGKMIEEIMSENTDKNIIVLCGHTHERTIVNIAQNIQCIVNNAFCENQDNYEKIFVW